jgi:hypothetical protein
MSINKCVKCGWPIGSAEESSDKKSALWNAVTKARTPINIFALAMMACASVLGVSAIGVDDCFSLLAFTFTIHAFLAVSGMFFLAILFCRKGIYHPEELNNVKSKVFEELGEDRPVIPAVLISLMMLGYGFYQLQGNPSEKCIGEPSRVGVQLNNAIIHFAPPRDDLMKTNTDS